MNYDQDGTLFKLLADHTLLPLFRYMSLLLQRENIQI